MSGYLQRLYDRAAGALPVTAPAFQPGSPLARFDQRLSIAELAQDFSFGGLPDALAAEREEVLVPIPSAPLANASPAAINAPPRPDKQEAIGPAEPEPGKTEIPSPARRRKPEQQAGRAKRREGARPGETRKLAATSPTTPTQRRPVETDLPNDAVAGFPAAIPSPTPTPVLHNEAVIAREATAPSAERPAAPMPRDKGAPPAAAAAPRPMPAAVPAPAHQPTTEQATEGRTKLSSAALPQLALQPRGGEIPALNTPQMPTIDWSEIDRRIEHALRGLNKPGSKHQAMPPAPQAGEQAQKDGTAAPAGFMTAAEASVIGSIEQSPRHRMLFGTRWR